MCVKSDHNCKDISSETYRFMFDHYLQQDTLYWSMLQYFITLQAGVLTASYILWVDNQILILFLLMCLSILLNKFLKKIIKKTYDDRSCNQKAMNDYEQKEGISLTDKTQLSVGKEFWDNIFKLFLGIYIVMPVLYIVICFC